MSILCKDYRPFLDSLDSLGFCTLRVFENETIDRLKMLYKQSIGNQEIDGMYASHNTNSAERGLQISKAIKEIVSESLQELLPDYSYFLGHFVVKGANVENEFALHQDWNIVDESRYKSYQIWMPLQLTSAANGGMFVVPGSHHFFNNYRSGSYGIPVVSYQTELDPIITDITVPPGNALIYHNGLFHASHPNKTDQIRIAVIVNFVQKIAPTYFFHNNADRGTTELYPISGDTLVGNLPAFEKGIISPDFVKEKEISTSPVENSKITAQDLISHFHSRFPETDAPQLKQLHIAKDPELENVINDKGYAIIDLLDENQIAIFKEKYLQHFTKIDRQPGRFITLQSTDAQTKKDIHDFIVEAVRIPLQKFFKDYFIPVSVYYTKKAHTSGDIELHADSTLLINHQLEPHYAIWVALMDVDEENGCLSVIPYSHKNQRTVYGGSFEGGHYAHRDWLRQYETPIPLKAGQAIVFDNNLLHNSLANSTDDDRICFTFRMTHKASDYYSFICADKDSRDINLYLEDHNYYMDENWDGDGKHLSGKLIGTLKDAIINFEKSEWVEKIER